MRIREGCILTATNSSDERVKSLIGCKGALHVVNGEPLRFVVGTNENARSFTTATTKRLGVIGVNIFVSTVTGTEYTFELISPNTAAVQEEQQPRFLLKELIYLNIITRASVKERIHSV